MQAPGPAHGNYNCYILLDVPGKGRGAFAQRNLKAGSTILVDKPIMVINQSPSAITGWDILREYQRLSPRQRAEFDQVPGIDPVGRQSTDVSPVDKFDFNRFETNDGTGCFVHASRFNHSCVPNCSMTQTSNGGMQCILVKDVAAGEELTFAYHPNFLYLTSDQRADFLQNLGLAFRECLCTICTQSQAEREVSDGRRALMRDAYHFWSQTDIVQGSGFPMPEAKLEGVRGYDYCFKNKVTQPARTFVELAEAEGIVSSQFLQFNCLFLAEVHNQGAKADRDMEEVKKWTERTIELKRNCIGEENVSNGDKDLEQRLKDLQADIRKWEAARSGS